jgi:hypothetical protein
MTPLFRFFAVKNLTFLHRLLIDRATVLAGEIRKASQIIVRRTMVVKSKQAVE